MTCKHEKWMRLHGQPDKMVCPACLWVIPRTGEPMHELTVVAPTMAKPLAGEIRYCVVAGENWRQLRSHVWIGNQWMRIAPEFDVDEEADSFASEWLLCLSEEGTYTEAIDALKALLRRAVSR